MRYLIAFFLLLSLPVYAAHPQGPTLKQVIASSDPLSGNFPASCGSPMAQLQMTIALQRWVGNRDGDEVMGIQLLPYGEAHSATGYTCFIVVTWRDQNPQTGGFTLQNVDGQHVYFDWAPVTP